ncbi:ATP/GTP-binding protein [Streptomyces sp. NPDC048508]|uniref:ATP/GTP-binding protein n=1 Tax=Streptomyces sp. NPDC048508 TaxID=3365561 RepID=UPI0037207B0B
MSDAFDINVVNLPAWGGDSGGMPDAPDGGDLFSSEVSGSSGDDGGPTDLTEGAAREILAIRRPMSPEVALQEARIINPPNFAGGGFEEGEYGQPRSLADRLGDWLEYRLEVARDRHASEAPFRGAEIARKTALLEARTAQETAMMEQNAKLHTALMKSKAAKAARGKADAARSSGSGLGADRGGRSRAGGGGGSGGFGRGSGGGNSPKGAGKSSDRSASVGKRPSKGYESSSSLKGRQNGSGGSGSGEVGTGKGSSGGSGGRHGSGSTGSGGSKGGRGAASPRAERARGRQDRAAARQAARQQRRGTTHVANLADRSKDRALDRAAVQAAREERRRVQAERKAAARAKREAAKAADEHITLGGALGEEAQRRWDKRRAAEKDKAAKDPEKPTDGDCATKKPDNDTKSGEKPSDASADADAKDSTGKDTDPKAQEVKDPPDAEDSDDERSFKEKLKDFFTSAGEDNTRPEPEEPSRFRPEDLGDVTVDRPGGPIRTPQPEPAEDDIPDAFIVDDPSNPFGAHVRSPASLPRAPEPHTQRPGTSRPTAQEDPVASEVNKTGMAAQHRTDITFGEYLMEIVNIAVAAALDKDRAQDLAVALGKVADALRDMAADLVGDHSIATEVVDQITDLADAADRMKQLAVRCAAECEAASEAARIAAMSVGRVYGEDIQAMDDAGLANASSAAHHD